MILKKIQRIQSMKSRQQVSLCKNTLRGLFSFMDENLIFECGCLWLNKEKHIFAEKDMYELLEKNLHLRKTVLIKGTYIWQTMLYRNFNQTMDNLKMEINCLLMIYRFILMNNQKRNDRWRVILLKRLRKLWLFRSFQLDKSFWILVDHHLNFTGLISSLTLIYDLGSLRSTQILA